LRKARKVKKTPHIQKLREYAGVIIVDRRIDSNYKQELIDININPGRYNTDARGYKNAIIPEASLEELDKYWGILFWSLNLIE